MRLPAFTSLSVAILLSSASFGSPQHESRATPALQNYLFPAFHTYSSGFTTASGLSVPGVSTVALSDSALNVIKVQSGLTHNVVNINGKTAWQANFPAGSWNPSNTPLGGFGFYVNGTTAFQNAVAKGANQVMFGYSVMFQNGFKWNLGGKLPGGCEYFDLLECLLFL